MSVRYEYRCIQAVVGFQGSVNLGQAANAVMWETLNKQMADGFEFVGTYPVEAADNPGCIAGLFGAQRQYRQINIMVFRRPG